MFRWPFKKKTIEDFVDECRGRYRQEPTELGYVCYEKHYCSKKEMINNKNYCRYVGIFDKEDNNEK